MLILLQEYLAVYSNTLWTEVFMFSFETIHCSVENKFFQVTLLHSGRPKVHTILAFLSAIGFMVAHMERSH